jgi:hypothetical protein
MLPSGRLVDGDRKRLRKPMKLLGKNSSSILSDIESEALSRSIVTS